MTFGAIQLGRPHSKSKSLLETQDVRYYKKLVTLCMCVLLSLVRCRVFLGLTHHVKISEFGESVNSAAAQDNVIHLCVSCVKFYWCFLMHFYRIEL